MKKNYVYFLAPLAGLLIFGAVYWNFKSGHEAKETERARVIKQAKLDKQAAQAKANEQAIRDALAGQERRKAEKAAKEAKDKKDHDDRQAAYDARDKAFREQEKYEKQVNRLEKDVVAETEAIAKLEGEKKKLTDEQVFLRIYVRQAEENVKKLLQVLDKIAAADAARAAAEAAAAKNKSS